MDTKVEVNKSSKRQIKLSDNTCRRVILEDETHYLVEDQEDVMWVHKKDNNIELIENGIKI